MATGRIVRVDFESDDCDDNEMVLHIATPQGGVTAGAVSWDMCKDADWRVGLKVAGKFVGHLHYERVGQVLAVFPSGHLGIADPNGVLAVKLHTGEIIIDGSEEWRTA